MKISDIESDKKYYVAFEMLYCGRSEKKIVSGERLIEMLYENNDYIILNFWEM